MNEKLNSHFNKNGFFYWIIGIIISMFGGSYLIKWSLKTISGVSDFLGIILYSRIWIADEISLVIIIMISFITLLWFVSTMIFMYFYYDSFKKINCVIVLIFFIIISSMTLVINNGNDIRKRIEILTPYITNDEHKYINKQLYLIKGKNDYLELEKYLDEKIDSYIKK